MYLWVFVTPISHTPSLVQFTYRPFLPLIQTTSNSGFNIHNFQVIPQEPIRNNTETAPLSRATQISVIGEPERGALANFSPKFVLRNAQIAILSTQPRGLQHISYPVFNYLSRIGESFASSLFFSLPADESALSAGVILGGNQRFSYQFHNQIRASGLLHLTAVSGYNITILISACLALFSIFGRGLFTTFAVLASILFFSLLTGGGASVIRAAIMGSVGFLALQAGSDRSTRRIFPLSLFIMLFLKPGWLFDIGWQLSASATASLIYIEPIILIFLRRGVEKVGDVAKFAQRVVVPQRPAIGGTATGTAMKWPIRNKQIFTTSPSCHLSSISTSLSAYLATFPIILYHFGTDNISWIGIFTNLLAQPLIPLVMASSALIGFSGMISLPLAQFIAIFARPPIWALSMIIQIGAKLNDLFI